jgi:hypothetical protein
LLKFCPCTPRLIFLSLSFIIKYERLTGDPTLIKRFVAGDWDAEHFLIVEPGQRIEASNDESVLRATDLAAE